MSRTSLLFLATLSLACERTPAPAPSGGSEYGDYSAAKGSAEGAALLAQGTPAPDLEFRAHSGEAGKLSSFRGKKVVVYFYPKDHTPGCTIEAQEIRDLWQEIAGTGAVVLGVSTDDEASHQRFARDLALPFLLVPDSDGKIAAKFGVPVVNGKARRVTFVIGKDGKVAKVFPEVKPKGHGAEILEALRSI